MVELVIASVIGALGTAAGLTGWMLLGASVISIGQVIGVAAYVAHKQRKARGAARDAYNSALQDRTVMIDIVADAPRTLALGRVRAVEGVRRRWASGTHDEKLTLIVSFASHRIDGFEAFYFHDTEVALDGNGYVTTAPYAKTRKQSRESGVITGTTFTIPTAFTAGSVRVLTSADINFPGSSDEAPEVVSCNFTLAGNVVTLISPRAESRVTWQALIPVPMARIRTYLGTDAQNVGADLAAEYPGKISAASRFAGIALAVVDLTYDPDVYPQGIPNITARFRGARVLDTRTSTTAWSDNPALLAHHYARHANGWNLPAGEIRTSDINAAANVCDLSTVFPMRNAAGVLTNVTLPRYRCGIVIDLTGDPRAAMDEIFETMAGKWGWAGGTWRMRAGTSAAPVFAMDQSWLAQRMGPDNVPEPTSVMRISNGTSRENKVNAVSGRCVDQDQRWQTLPFPAVRDTTLIAAEGRVPARGRVPRRQPRGTCPVPEPRGHPRRAGVAAHRGRVQPQRLPLRTVRRRHAHHAALRLRAHLRGGDGLDLAPHTGHQAHAGRDCGRDLHRRRAYRPRPGAQRQSAAALVG